MIPIILKLFWKSTLDIFEKAPKLWIKIVVKWKFLIKLLIQLQMASYLNNQVLNCKINHYERWILKKGGSIRVRSPWTPIFCRFQEEPVIAKYKKLSPF